MSPRICMSALLLSLLSACSLVKLSDKISQENCQDDSDCKALNDEIDRDAKDFNACNVWQCSSKTKLCEFSAIDSDHDQFTPATVKVNGEDEVCEANPAKQDCDDKVSTKHPGLDEGCDNLDNDCDSNIDEGALDPKPDVAVTFTGPAAGDVSYAVDPATGAVGLGYSINETNPKPGFTLLKNELPAGANAAAVTAPIPEGRSTKPVLYAESVGVGALGNGKFGMAFFNGSGKRLVAGLIDTNGDPSLLGSETLIAGKGLHCSAAETTAGSCASTTPATRTPALAALGGDVLISYVRAAADPSGMCRLKDDAVPGHELLGNVVNVVPEIGFAEKTKKAFVLGFSSALEAPALIAIPAASSGATAFGWLLAYVDEDGAIALKRVELSGNELSAGPVLATISDKDHRFLGLQMVLGPKVGDAYTVGIAFQRGCTVEARVGVVFFKASASDKGEATLAQLGELVMVGGVPNENRPAIAYSQERKSWGVVYREPKALHARLLTADGALLGDEPYDMLLTVKTGADAREMLFSPAIVASATDGWFAGLIFSQRGGNPSLIESATLASCAKKP